MPDKPISDRKSVILDKKVGETPLEALERFRTDQHRRHPEYGDLPMTYAGRLDPMAEGKLLILIGDECKNKEKYLGLDKEYEVEILFGVETDTHDMLGRILKVDANVATGATISAIDIQKYAGKFDQEYPAYSSRTVAGKALHMHARAGTLPESSDDWPKKSVEIYSIDVVQRETMTGSVIARDTAKKIGKVKEKTEGDFRKKEISADWLDFGKKYAGETFTVIKISVACSSGTYMRSLAKRIGDDAGIGAMAFSIVRTRIGEYKG